MVMVLAPHTCVGGDAKNADMACRCSGPQKEHVRTRPQVLTSTYHVVAKGTPKLRILVDVREILNASCRDFIVGKN